MARAEEAYKKVLTSDNLDSLEENWKLFLHKIERVWNKASDHYKKSPRWNGWKGRYESDRKRDSLLSYLINARGAEEHTVTEITKKEVGSIEINGKDGNLYIEKMIMKNGVIMELNSPHPIEIKFSFARVKLLPVVNRGRTYDPPKEHLGESINPENIAEICEKSIGYYRDFLQKADEFFVK